jgi:hypothetical protein
MKQVLIPYINVLFDASTCVCAMAELESRLKG